MEGRQNATAVLWPCCTGFGCGMYHATLVGAHVRVGSHQLARVHGCRYGRVLRPYVGLTLMDVPGSRMRQLQAACPDFPRSVQSAVVVTRVAPNSPAAAAGIQEDDVIVGCEGGTEQTLGTRALANLFKTHIGQPLALKILRQQRNANPPSDHDRQPLSKQDAEGDRGYSYTMLPVSVKPIEARPT